MSIFHGARARLAHHVPLDRFWLFREVNFVKTWAMYNFKKHPKDLVAIGKFNLNGISTGDDERTDTYVVKAVAVWYQGPL